MEYSLSISFYSVRPRTTASSGNIVLEKRCKRVASRSGSPRQSIIAAVLSCLGLRFLIEPSRNARRSTFLDVAEFRPEDSNKLD